jgi:hypothetical protein
MSALIAAIAAASYNDVINDDTGSLRAGKVTVAKGDAILIVGEKGPREVTYTMGSVERGNLRVCCKGQGAYPIGAVSFAVLAGLGHLARSTTLPEAPSAKVVSKDELLTELEVLLDLKKAV